jgi:hypothetical protein
MVVKGNVRAERRPGTAGNQDLTPGDTCRFAVALNFHRVRTQKQRASLIDINPVTFQLRSNYLGLSGNDSFHTGGDILHRNVAMNSRPVAVEGAYSKTAKLKDSLTDGFAGDSVGMNAHASDHAGPLNYGHALARLCRSDGAFPASRATADYDKVIFCCAHLGRLKSGNANSRSSQ